MKILMEIDGSEKATENDIIVNYHGKWSVVHKDLFLAEKTKEIQELKKELEESKAKYDSMFEKVKGQINILAKAIGGNE